MPSDPIRQELLTLMKRAVFLNVAAYLISIIAVGVTLRFAAGLLLGTAVLLCTLLLLRLSVLRMEDDAKRFGTTSQRRYLLFYALRMLVFAAAFAAALLFRTRISPVAVVLPMLYPRLIYTAGSLLSGTGKHSRIKKR